MASTDLKKNLSGANNIFWFHSSWKFHGLGLLESFRRLNKRLKAGTPAASFYPMIWRWERMFHGAKCQKARWNWFHPVWGHIYLLNAYLFVRQGHIVGPFLRHEFCPVVSRSPWAMKRCYRFSRRSDLGWMGFNWYKFSRAINKGFDFGTSFDHLSAELFLICRFCCGCSQSKISMCVLPFFKFHFADIVGAGKNTFENPVFSIRQDDVPCGDPVGSFLHLFSFRSRTGHAQGGKWYFFVVF